MHGLRDVGAIRAFLTGPGIVALFDAPWVPIFVLIIWLFHPLLGGIALAGAVLLFSIAWLNERLSRKPLEQMQLEMLPDLPAMKGGEIRLIEALGRLYVFRVVATQEAPVNEETALPLIQQFLSKQRSAEAVAPPSAARPVAPHIELGVRGLH
jgi:ABC-type protease/lipase transport system fused ATPase/permease subunit